MKHKLLSILLCLAMALSLLPTAALADEKKVAEVDKIEYATLQEAINAAKSGSTVHLLDNVTLTEPAVFPAGKKVDLNLRGHNITATGTALRINGTTDIQSTGSNGVIESTGNVAVAVGDNAKVTVFSGTLKGREGAVITGTSTGATIEIRYKATLIATDNAVIAGNGSQRDGKPNTILVKGSTFIGGIQSKGYIACGIYAPWNDNVTVSGGTFNITNGAGIVARAGTVKVTDGTFNCTGTAEGYVGDSKNKVPCAALVFDKAANYPALTEDSKILVSGGSFSTDPAANGATLAVGYVATSDENGVYGVHKSNPVAEINGVKYDTLQAAITAAQATKGGATITLLKNINTESYYTVNGDNPVTIDLNGHNITGSGISGLFYVTAKGDLTIKGDGVVTAVEDNHAAMVVWVRSPIAKVTLEGGTYKQQITNTSDNHFDLIYVEYGTAYIKGGTYEGATPEWTLNCKDEHYPTEAKIEVTGGTFKNFDPANNKAEGENTSFLPEGYTSTKNADGTYTAKKVTYVARIGETRYETLTAAIENAEDGDTVTLMKDVTEKVSISKNLVLDLNGKTLTGENLVNSNGKNERIALTANAREVKVKNGIIDGRVNAYDSADLTIDADVTVKNSYNGSGYDCFGIVVWGDGTFGQDGCKTPKLTVNGKVIMEKGGVAISTNGNDKSCAIVTINNGAVISTTEDGAIYLPSGKLTMNGGTVSGPTGIQICAGSTNITSEFKLHNGTVIATGADERTSKGTGDGLIPDGAAISVVNRNYPNGVPSVTIDGGSFSSANSDAVLAYSWSNGAASEWTDAKTYVKINDGYFSSDPSAYVADGHHVDGSNRSDYPYEVKVGPKTGAAIIVTDNTSAGVAEGVTGLTEADKTAISRKTEVDGVTEAIGDNKATLVGSAANGADKVEVKVEVKVNVTGADMTSENKTLTFEAKPVATIKVDGTVKATNVAVPNSLLSGEITVKLPLPAGFTPEQIKHISSDRSVEYFLKTEKRGAKTFEIKDDCAVFKITKFSTFELSDTATYVEPSYYSGSSSYDPTYSVTVDKTENGSVTASPKSASKGDTVTVTVKPDSGYVLETLTVTDKNGNELTLKDKGNGKYTFTMPAGKVEVKATFMEDNSMLNFFYDVPNNAYFYEAVKWAVKNGITTGVGNDLFAPEQPCTRAQIVTFLWRAAGSPEPKGAASGMTDVVSGSYYEKAVAWAIENGITTGTTASTFSPDATCTRAQAVTFLARALKAKAASAAEFSDVPTGSYFADAVAWAAANGVTEGIGGGLFGSDNDCTRGQIVTFLYRAYNK